MIRSLPLFVGVVCCFTTPAFSGQPTGENPPEKTVAQWTAQLAAPEKTEKLLAIEALADRGNEAAEAVPALLGQLDDADTDIRVAAATALGSIGAEADRVIPALIEQFSDRSLVVKFDPHYDVIPAFAFYGSAVAMFGEQAVSPLIKALDSESAPVCLASAVALEAIGEPAATATPKLIEMLESSDSIRRNAAAGAIRGIGPGAAEAIPALVKLLHDEDFHTQYWACRALGAIGPPAAVASRDLLDLLVNGSLSVRRNAAAALGDIGPDIGPDAAARLIQAVDNDRGAPLRENAVIALGKLKPYAKESVPALKRFLTDPEFPAPTHAARSLWLLTGDPGEALPTLTRSLDDLTYFQLALEVLAEMGPQAAPAVDRLIVALGERDPDDRIATAYALAHIGPPAAKAIEPLRELLDDQEPGVRKAAEAAIESLSDSKPR